MPDHLLSAVADVAKILHERACDGACSLVPGLSGLPIPGCPGEPTEAEYETATAVLEAAIPHIAGDAKERVRAWLGEMAGTIAGAVAREAGANPATAPFVSLIAKAARTTLASAADLLRDPIPEGGNPHA